MTGIPAVSKTGRMRAQTRTASSTVCSRYLPACQRSKSGVPRTMTVGYTRTPSGRSAAMSRAVCTSLSSSAPGRPVIICKMSRNPAAFTAFAARATSSAVCPRPESASTLSDMLCAPSSTVRTPQRRSLASTSPSMASGRVERRRELSVPSAR